MSACGSKLAALDDQDGEPAAARRGGELHGRFVQIARLGPAPDDADGDRRGIVEIVLAECCVSKIRPSRMSSRDVAGVLRGVNYHGVVLGQFEILAGDALDAYRSIRRSMLMASGCWR